MALSSPSYWQLPPPPPGLNYLGIIRHSLPFILINAVFAAILIPIFIALLFFSTPRSRRTLIFHFNVVAVILGIGEGILSLTFEIHDLLSPHNTLPQDVMTTRFIICLFTPLLVESILVLRLAAVFPPTTHSRRTRYLVLLFPVIMKVVRVVSVSLVTASWISMTQTLGQAGRMVWSLSPFMKMAWIAQLLDNTYASTIFIYRLKSRKGPYEVYTGGALRSRLQTICIIAFSNYVFPTLLSLAQIILVFRDPNPGSPNPMWFTLCLLVLNVNTFTTILGVVFATVWTSGGKWAYVTGITEEQLLRTMSVVRANNGTVPDLRPVMSLRLVPMREGREEEEESVGDLEDWQSIRRRSLTMVESMEDRQVEARPPVRRWSLAVQLPPLDFGDASSPPIPLAVRRASRG